MKKADLTKNVLIVDDEADIRELLDLTMARMGLSADCAATLAEARAFLENREYQLCLTDMRLPDGEGLELVQFIGERHPQMPVAVITAHGSMENAVAALKAGAFDYLAKPVSLDQLRLLVKTALVLPAGTASEGRSEGAGVSLIGDSPAMRDVRSLLDRAARSQAPIHLHGESGTGKEMAARMIHALSARRDGPFVWVNCGRHSGKSHGERVFRISERGLHRGADSDRDGFFQAAGGGTLFLDEVADLPAAMQVKLLRAIQEKRVRKVGSPIEEPVDVRIVSATHQTLRERVTEGLFLSGSVFPIERDRSTDATLARMRR